MNDMAAYIGLALLALLTVFQLALIFGAPLGKFAWGGQHEVLPKRLRVGSATSIVIYGLFAALLMSKSGIWASISDQPTVQVGLWIVTVYSALGVFVNAISRSKPERAVMTPVAAVLFVCFLVVTLN